MEGRFAVIGVLAGLVCAIIALVVLIAILADEVLRSRADVDEERDAQHAKCIAHVADVTSKRIVAMALREYARRWDSVEEKANLIALAREQYKPGGPNMPAIWMNQQADLLDPQEK